MPSKDQSMSSRELLARIGLSDDSSHDLLDDEPLDNLTGDVGPALRTRCRSFQERHVFAPGDLVTWKPGLKNRCVPRYGHPAVVVGVLDQPVIDDQQESGSTYFHEPLDLVLGLFWESGPARGEFLTWHFDSRRLQPWTPEV